MRSFNGLVLALGLAAAGCGGRPSGDATALSVPAASARVVTMPTDAQMLMLLKSSCVGCHVGATAPMGVVLNTIAGAKAAAVAAKAALSNGVVVMPPVTAAQPNAADKAQMLAWFTAHS